MFLELDSGLNVEMDLRGLSFLGSTGIGVIVTACKRVRASGGHLLGVLRSHPGAPVQKSPASWTSWNSMTARRCARSRPTAQALNGVFRPPARCQRLCCACGVRVPDTSLSECAPDPKSCELDHRRDDDLNCRRPVRRSKWYPHAHSCLPPSVAQEGHRPARRRRLRTMHRLRSWAYTIAQQTPTSPLHSAPFPRPHIVVRRSCPVDNRPLQVPAPPAQVISRADSFVPHARRSTATGERRDSYMFSFTLEVLFDVGSLLCRDDLGATRELGQG